MGWACLRLRTLGPRSLDLMEFTQSGLPIRLFWGQFRC